MSGLRSCSVPFVALAALLGCDSVLGISPSNSATGEEQGGAGSGGTAGKSGSAHGAQSGDTGDAGEATSGGAGGEPTGGAAGDSGSGGAGGGGRARGGAGGSGSGSGGGSGATTGFPQMGQPCSIPGALACTAPLTQSRVLCNEGFWEQTAPCVTFSTVDVFCDRRDGACRAAVCDEGEIGRGVYCNTATDLLAVCGPDRVSTTPVPCPRGCLDASKCKPLESVQLIIDKPRSVLVDENAWPTRLIPVCWRAPDAEDDRLLRAAVRLAVESLWSRSTPLGFTGWGACSASEARVELDFAENCDGELARVPFIGYPGPGTAFPVTICKSYYDAEATRHERIEPEILEFVARHVFVHVAGIEDHDSWNGYTAFLEPVFDPRTFRDITLGDPILQVVERWYGATPGRSLMAPDGRCLTYDDDTLLASACDGSVAQAFEIRDPALVHAGPDDSCFGSSAGVVALEPCTSDPPPVGWSPDHVRVRDHFDQCWQPISSTSAGSALVPARCNPNWPEEQSFRFEFVGSGRVRIHVPMRTTSDGCIVAPDTWTSNAVPSFGACDSERGIFEAFAGTLGQDGRCLFTAESYSILVEPCSAAPEQQYRISGPFELSGNALTWTDGDTLSSTALEAPPGANQIFDYRF